MQVDNVFSNLKLAKCRFSTIWAYFAPERAQVLPCSAHLPPSMVADVRRKTAHTVQTTFGRIQFKNLVRLTGIVICSTWLIACGQSGPLYLPAEKPVEKTQ